MRQKNTPFCIALNKIDRLHTWKPTPDLNSRDTMEQQSTSAINHFKSRLDIVRLAFNELGMNVELYWENNSLDDT